MAPASVAVDAPCVAPASAGVTLARASVTMADECVTLPVRGIACRLAGGALATGGVTVAVEGESGGKLHGAHLPDRGQVGKFPHAAGDGQVPSFPQ